MGTNVRQARRSLEEKAKVVIRLLVMPDLRRSADLKYSVRCVRVVECLRSMRVKPVVEKDLGDSPA